MLLKAAPGLQIQLPHKGVGLVQHPQNGKLTDTVDLWYHYIRRDDILVGISKARGV